MLTTLGEKKENFVAIDKGHLEKARSKKGVVYI